jgi:hypothetical protein
MFIINIERPPAVSRRIMNIISLFIDPAKTTIESQRPQRYFAVLLFPRIRPENTLFAPFSFPEAYGMLRNGGYVGLDSRPAQLKKVEFG